MLYDTGESDSALLFNGVGTAGGGSEVQRGGDIRMPVAGSCWCVAEPAPRCKAVILQLNI